MPFGCFGKRRKRDKPDEQLAEKAGIVGDNNAAGTETHHAEPAHNGVENATKLAGITTADEPEVSEVVTVARAHSLHASAPNTVEHRHTTIGIQKSATLARYDFLRKSDYGNTADRWAALKQQYLSPSMSSSQSQHHQHPSSGQNGSVKRTAQSLPRQFAPPSITSGPVRFSQWFYERQIKEEDARREFLEREEKNRKLIEGEDEAAADDVSTPEKSIAAAADDDDDDTAEAAADENAGEVSDGSCQKAGRSENEASEAAAENNAGAADLSDRLLASTYDTAENGGRKQATTSDQAEAEEQYDNDTSQQPTAPEETQSPAERNQDSDSEHHDATEEKEVTAGEEGLTLKQPEDLKDRLVSKTQSDNPAAEAD